ncbi:MULTISPECIES: SUMF1/EgtB/PvdO family nonheme iron enzyme [unclassified Caballeronia]|uniref:SUMF1/EgtB/PvdO family nonheme iron enzyme n=1 Tax=unclassified Caballeronia TaxID=2646786 RepID=UPI0028670CC2|nr:MULTISPECIES: SUMF1/EgtB/PvdO family nonheme iron enzyme [unclassified Caballeronia]MDR5775492.1 SUMF1/EgtB/PvdO family nonheme iron enzyme [Caballeronia sp. LZ002]MDR5850930.1 SUMF1/EgtB/PvdO family nonheme iron enzyme [Caballeronia sp. LZ003]
MWRTLFIAGMFVTMGGAFAAPSDPPLERPSVAAADTHANRMALVIGNTHYGDAPLPAAEHDAYDMSVALTSLGFNVTRRIDLNETAMRDALDTFVMQLGPHDTALVYFAGHGLQAGGDALLAPLDARADAPVTLVEKGIPVKDVVARMVQRRPDAANIVVLDMCLNDPFGAAPTESMSLPANTLVAYATTFATEAAETERNGLYTAALLRAMSGEARTTSGVFAIAAANVAQLTHDSQRPWIASTLDAAFTLAPMSLASTDAIDATQSATGTRTRGILPKDSSEQYELTFWESIKDSTYPSDYEAYLKAYPNGRFATLAKARIDRLRAAAASAKPAASPQLPASPTPAPTPKPAPPVVAEKPRQTAPTTTPAPATTTATVAVASRPAAKTSAGAEVKDCPSCPALVPLSAGSFNMGSNNDDPAEKPPHRVAIAQPYLIGKYEVTIEQWNACVDAGACTRISPDGDAGNAPPANAPMRNVSWDDAQVYVKWLSKVGGKAYRLPTEAEWEYAARGGTQSTYWWGDQMKKGNADCKDCGEPYRPEAPMPVGSFAANPYGLHDMNGSVWEWVADCWHGNYKGAPADGHAWDDPSCSVRVIRGGSWREGASYMQSATRFKYSSSVRQSQNGFRVARDAQ